MPNPPEADYLFQSLKTIERSETLILGTLGILVHFRHLFSTTIG